MYKTKIVFILVIFLLILNIVEATPGRLNSAGCHNSQAEGYHCHGSSYSSSEGDGSYEQNTERNNTPINYSNLIGSTGGLVITHAQPLKKQLGEDCVLNLDCNSSYCVHNFCRSETYFFGDGYCDPEENCLISSVDCGSCNNNFRCDVFANEDCSNTKECTCNGNNICDPIRDQSRNDGCYKISCGDGYIDGRETQKTCCLDTRCDPSKNVLKVTFCEEISQSCKSQFKGYVKVIFGLLIFSGSLLSITLIINKSSLKKSHKLK